MQIYFVAAYSLIETFAHLYKETYRRMFTVLEDCKQPNGPSLFEKLNIE